MSKRQLQAKATKDLIMKTARTLIEELTYERVTIEAICKASNVSIGAFYHHFKSKQDLIVVGYEECDEYFKEKVFEQLKSSDPVARIAEYIGFQMDYATSVGIDLMIQVYKAQITDGNDFFLNSSRALPQGLCALVEEGQAAGRITKNQSAESISSELLIISRGVIYNWCQSKGNYDLKSHCHKIISGYIKSYTI